LIKTNSGVVENIQYIVLYNKKRESIMEDSKKTIIYPCKGTEKLGLLPGHLYGYNSKTGPFVTKLEARELCPERRYLLTSGEFTLCPICRMYKEGKLEINLLK
jgi:hypothetical protein